MFIPIFLAYSTVKIVWFIVPKLLRVTIIVGILSILIKSDIKYLSSIGTHNPPDPSINVISLCFEKFSISFLAKSKSIFLLSIFDATEGAAGAFKR